MHAIASRRPPWRRLGVLLCGVLAAPLLHAEDGLTRADVAGLLHDMHRAVESQNADAVTALFTDDALIELRIREDGQWRNAVLALPAYAGMLREGWRAADRYAYEIDDVRIELGAEGGAAQVSNTTRETIHMGDRVIRSRIEQRYVVVPGDAGPRITAMTARIRRRDPVNEESPGEPGLSERPESRRPRSAGPASP